MINKKSTRHIPLCDTLFTGCRTKLSWISCSTFLLDTVPVNCAETPKSATCHKVTIVTWNTKSEHITPPSQIKKKKNGKPTTFTYLLIHHSTDNQGGLISLWPCKPIQDKEIP